MKKPDLCFLRYVFIAAAFIVMAVSIYLCALRLDESRNISALEGWYYIEDGERVEVTLPLELERGDRDTLVLYTDALGDYPGTEAVTTKAAVYRIHAYAGDEELYAYDDNGFDRSKVMRSRIDCLIDVPEDMGEKTLTIVYYALEDESVFEIPVVYFGNVSAIFRHYLISNIFNLTVCAVMLTLSVLATCLYFYLRAKRLTDVRILDCAAFLFLAAVMGITDSSLGILMSNQSPFLCYLSFYSFMLVPAPLAYIMLHTAGMSKYISMRVLPPLIFANTLIQTVLDIMGIFTLTEMNFVTLIVMVGGFGIALACFLIEYRHSKSPELMSAFQIFISVGVVSIYCIALYALFEISYYLEIFDCGIIAFSIVVVYRLIGQALGGDRYRRDAELEKNMSIEDAMTKLPNRRAYDEAMESLEKETALSHDDATLVYLDVNGLKYVNDNFGHDDGDELIIGAARCIYAAFAGIGMSFRIGGDEFAAIIGGYGGDSLPLQKAVEKEVAAYNETHEHKLSIAMGFSKLYDEMGLAKRFSDWKKEADDEMYRNKAEMKKAMAQEGNAGTSAAVSS